MDDDERFLARAIFTDADSTEISKSIRECQCPFKVEKNTQRAENPEPNSWHAIPFTLKAAARSKCFDHVWRYFSITARTFMAYGVNKTHAVTNSPP